MSNYRKSDEALSRLSPEQFRVTQESGTERPGTGEYLDNHEPGIYVDIVSGEPLFASSDKFGESVLHTAATWGGKETVSLLLDNDVNVDIQNRYRA